VEQRRDRGPEDEGIVAGGEGQREERDRTCPGGAIAGPEKSNEERAQEAAGDGEQHVLPESR
jgi:hypothetical protein